MRYLLMALSIIFVSGCVPYSDAPITEPGVESIDSSIIGTWYWNDEHDSGYIHIGLNQDTTLLRLVMLDFDRKGEMEVSEFSGHTSLLEGRKYLNLKWVRPTQKDISGYMLAKYEVIDDSFGIALMDNNVTENAIQDGIIKGKVIKDKWITSVHITEEEKNLQEFILLKNKELFREFKYLQKLKLPNQ